MNNIKNVFRKQLKVNMAEAEINTAQLSDMTNISADTIRKYRRGETTPTLQNIAALAVALNCTPNDLCGFTDKTRK